MNGVAAVMGLALIEYFALGFLVGWARGKYKVAAPATTGDPIFERYFRVHQNTLESLIVFIPGLWLFATYVNTPIAVALGLIFIAARIIYAAGYIKAPEKREVGAGLTFLVNAALVLGGLAGIARHAL
ncbi:MAG TPA: MAPEG family protein [Candidatus Binataceae bacterium]|nr:MAPEG family protein [Candidatus Binataceae bacterium]